MTRRIYLEDPYAIRVEAGVVGWREEGGCWLRLEATIFHPEGGGQPADHGMIDGMPVRALRVTPTGEIEHLVERPPSGPWVLLEIDAERRGDHRAQHTAGHLLSGLAWSRHGWATDGFRIEADTTTICWPAVGAPQDEHIDEIFALANTAIREGRATQNLHLDPGELDAYGVRRGREAPAGSGPLRVLEIDGIDRNPCGGTHCRSLSELQLVSPVSRQRHGGGVRLKVVAGSRALVRADDNRKTLDRLVSDLRTPSEKLPEAARALIAERDGLLQDLAMRSRALGRLTGIAAAATGQAVANLDLPPEPAVMLAAGEGWAAASGPLPALLWAAEGDGARWILLCPPEERPRRMATLRRVGLLGGPCFLGLIGRSVDRTWLLSALALLGGT